MGREGEKKEGENEANRADVVSSFEGRSSKARLDANLHSDIVEHAASVVREEIHSDIRVNNANQSTPPSIEDVASRLAPTKQN